MTQALINTLNTIPEKTVNLTQNMPKTEGLDFGRIFESKKNISDNDNNSSDIQLQNVSDVIKVSESDTDNNIQTLKNEILPENNNIKDILQAVISECVSDENAEDNAAIKVLTIIETQEEAIANIITNENSDIADEITSEEMADTEATADVEETKETIITEEEEPTMYNELNTLEDPTAVILLQSQIQKTITKVTENDEQTVLTSAKSSLKTTDSQLNSNNNDASPFRQFDVIGSKETVITNIAPKESTHLKAENSKVSSVINENIIKELNAEVISSESAEAEGSMGDLMQNQSPQEQAARVMIQGDIKYETVESETAKTTSQVKTANVTPSKIIEQISKQLENMFNNSKLNMVLNPGTLGKVNLQLVNARDGLMAQFTVTTQEARDLLMKGLDGLKESLLAQGVSVDSVTIKLEEADSENAFDWTEREGSKGGNKHHHAGKQKEDAKNFEQMMFEIENEENV